MALTAETVVVVVDSNIQRNVLATEKTTVTQQASHRTIKCQSRSWSQTGTKVNGSRHGDNRIINSFFPPLEVPLPYAICIDSARWLPVLSNIPTSYR